MSLVQRLSQQFRGTDTLLHHLPDKTCCSTWNILNEINYLGNSNRICLKFKDALKTA